jgi:hypothetical protein
LHSGIIIIGCSIIPDVDNFLIWIFFHHKLCKTQHKKEKSFFFKPILTNHVSLKIRIWYRSTEGITGRFILFDIVNIFPFRQPRKNRMFTRMETYLIKVNKFDSESDKIPINFWFLNIRVKIKYIFGEKNNC